MTNSTETPWPAGVIARYLTVAGATVDLTGGGDHTYYRCTGCGDGASASWWNERRAREIAQGHAEKCRALPKPVTS
ncbi:hypothetical protein ACFVTY_02075 [Streptomyces sp. NPDC058067]|uniref:hypothetical protein n=1 Tax=Streptomyces sp. NPDC058067 TaxID=3346324 RepID=UPI0036E41E95